MTQDQAGGGTGQPSWWTPELADLAAARFAIFALLAIEDADPLIARYGSGPKSRSLWQGCVRCGGSLEGMRSDARFCSGACRQAVWRAVRAGRVMSEADLVAWLRAEQRERGGS